MTGLTRLAGVVLAAGCTLGVIDVAQASTLRVANHGRFPIACTADGWKDGAKNRVFIAPVDGEARIDVAPEDANRTLDWVQCGAVMFNRLAMPADGTDRRLVLKGLEIRSLKVALYPYLPTDPAAGFTQLLAHVVETYQAQNPQVALDVVMTDVGIYDFAQLPQLLQGGGYQVMELDMLYLGFLAQRELVNASPPSSENALPVAVAASTWNGTRYGVPSWLCMDFLYSNDPNLANVASLGDLVKAMPPSPNGGMALVGDFNGSWRLPSIYINSFVQRYGYGQIANAFTVPADPAVIGDLKTLTSYCATVTLTGNPCTNGTNHSLDSKNPGAPERIFASGSTAVDVGFSERSFFIATAGAQPPSTIIPVPWSTNPQPLLYADSFVTSAANCAPGSSCTADAQAFTDMMTGLDMRNYIVKSADLAAGSPWRTLLVANAAFYEQPEIMNNRLYQQYSKVFATAQPFPNNFTAALQTAMKQGVCRGLKGVTTYTCDAGTNVPALAASPAISGIPEFAPASGRHAGLNK